MTPTRGRLHGLEQVQGSRDIARSLASLTDQYMVQIWQKSRGENILAYKYV